MKQTWKRSLCAILAFCMVLACVPGVVLTSHATPDAQGGTILNLDFEDQAVGTSAADAGWKITTKTASEAYTAEIQELDENGKKNKVLALEMDTTEAQAADHVILTYPLSGEYDQVSMTYKVRFSEGKKGIAYLPSLGRDTSQLVCLSMNTAAPLSYQPETGGWAKLQVTEDGETFTDFGAYAANVWYTIRTDYVHTDEGWSAKTYVDGKLTNATVKKDVSWMKAAKDIVAFLTSFKGTAGTIYLDDFQVTLPGGEEPEQKDVLNLDFEKTAAGTDATAAGWTMNPAATESVNAKIIDLQGNHVLALRVDEKPASHEFLTYALENVPASGYDKLTYSYNIAFSANANYLFMPSLGTKDSQLVCLNSDGTYTPDNRSWPKLKYAESGEEVGRYQNMTWYTVKTVYEKTADGVTASTYVNGQLTDAGMRNKLTKIDHVIIMAMTYASKYGYTVYVDNIRITEDDHTPAAPAKLVSDTLSFDQEEYEVMTGATVSAAATMSAGAEDKYTLAYKVENTDVATVAQDGRITGKTAGSTVLTVTATNKEDSRIVLTASTKITVVDGQPGAEIYYENFDNLDSIEELTDWTITDGTQGDAKFEIADNPEGGKMLLLTRRGLKDGSISATLNSGVFRAAEQVELTYRVMLIGGCDTYLPIVTSNQGNMHLYNYGAGAVYYQYPKGNSSWAADVGEGTGRWVDVKVIIDTKQNKWFLWYDGEYAPIDRNTLYNKGLASAISIFTLSSAHTINGLAFDDIQMRPLTACESVKFEQTEMEIIAGNTVPLKLVYTPEDTTLKGATFTSSNTSIATVDKDGNVTAKKAGTVTITARPLCGQPTIRTKVTVVYKGIQEIVTDYDKLDMKVGQTQFLEVSAKPEISSETLVYASSDESVVRVDEWGEAWALSAGKATLTVSVKENPEMKKEIAVTVAKPGVMASIYVAPNGSADGDGSKSSPVTIARALELIDAKNDNMTGNIEVILAGGYYSVSKTIEMNEHHGGSNGYSVIWKAAEGETPVIGSAYTIAGSKFTATAENPKIYVTDVPSWLDTRQMFVNNVRATRARSEGGLTNSDFLTENGTNLGYVSDDVQYASFARVEDLELVFKEEWTQPRIGVASASVVDGKLNMVLDQPGWRYLLDKGQTKAKSYGPVWIENALELLDKPGEWYLDTEADKLYYMPRPFEDMSKVTVSLPTIDGELLTVTGSGFEDNQMARNIGFEGITFADTTWLRPNSVEGHADVQNNHIRDYGDHLQTAAVLVQRTNGIHFTGCTFTRLGINGLEFINGVQNVIVEGNRFYDISSDAIAAGFPQTNYFPTGNESMKNYEINNNYIHDIGVDFGSSAAISVSFVANYHSQHNEIFNVPYSGYHIGYGWAVRKIKNLKNMDIGYNFIHDYMGDGIYDGGAIYTLGNSNGESYNLIHDNYAKNQMNRTGVLYSDQGATWYEWRNNVVDLSEVSAWNGGNLPAWAWLSDSPEYVRYIGNYTTTAFYGKDGRIKIVSDESELGPMNTVQMSGNQTYDPANPPAAAQAIIDASGLESAYASLRGGQAERIKTNLADQLGLDINETYAVSVKLTDGKDKTVSGGRLTIAYEMADSSIATVSDTGVVKGIAKGTTTLRIYVVSNDILDVIETPVVVGDTLKELRFEDVDGEIRMSVSSTGKQLTPTVLTEMGHTLTPDSVVYTVADETIAKVSAEGLVTPVAAGETTVTVTATVNGKSISATVTVIVTELDLSNTDDLWEIFDKDQEDKWTKKDYGGTTWNLVDGKSITTKLNGYATFAGCNYDSELFTFKLKIDDSTGGGAWPAFVLKAESDKSYVSADLVDGYMFCMAKDGIAVFRFIDGMRYQIYGGVAEGGSCTNVIKQGGTIQDSPWSMKEEHEIQVGAITDGDDVRLILNIDGEKVIDFVDPGAQKAITTPGYFGIIGRGETFTLTKINVYESIEDNIWEIFDKEKEDTWTRKIGTSDTWNLVDDTSITAKINGFCTFTGAQYDQELMHFLLKIDHSTGGGGWPAIVLKAESDKSYVSADLVDGYMFCMAKGGIDVFRFIDGVRYQIYGNIAEGGACTNVVRQGGTITDSAWSMKETHDIRVGAITDGDDVRVMLIIDGEEVVNFVDPGAEKAITTPGYFGFIGRGETFTFTKISDGVDTATVTVAGSGAKDVQFEAKAERDQAYTFQINEESGYLYSVEATMSGKSVDVSENDGVYTIAKVTGDIVLTVTKTEKGKPEAVKQVEAMIDAIGEVTLDSREAIEAARAAYDALTEEEKAMVSNYETLVAAEKKLAELQKAADAAKAVEEKIDAIGEVTLDSREAIEAARAAYDALTEEEKELVSNYVKLLEAEKKLAELQENAKAAEEVKKLIDAIGEVTLKSEKQIQQARKAYDALTEEQKKLVDNLDTLVAAERRLEELKKANDGKKPVKTDDSANIGLYLTLSLASILAVAALVFCKLAEKRRKYNK